MPCFTGIGLVDLRLLTFTLDQQTVTLHYFVRREQLFNPNGTVQIDAPIQYYFLLREIDNFIRLNSDDWHFDATKRSEQAVRTEVNNVVNTILGKQEHIYCTPEELKALKSLNILSHRAPHAVLTPPFLVIQLLRHFMHDIKAVIFESILLNLTAESRQLRHTLLSLKSTVYNYNETHGLSHDDQTSSQLMKHLLSSSVSSIPYPPPWAHHFRDGINSPCLDLKSCLLLNHAFTHVKNPSEQRWHSLSSPAELSNPSDLAVPFENNPRAQVNHDVPIAHYDYKNTPHLPPYLSTDVETQKRFATEIQTHFMLQEQVYNNLLKAEHQLKYVTQDGKIIPNSPIDIANVTSTTSTTTTSTTSLTASKKKSQSQSNSQSSTSNPIPSPSQLQESTSTQQPSPSPMLQPPSSPIQALDTYNNTNNALDDAELLSQQMSGLSIQTTVFSQTQSTHIVFSYPNNRPTNVDFTATCQHYTQDRPSHATLELVLKHPLFVLANEDGSISEANSTTTTSTTTTTSMQSDQHSPPHDSPQIHSPSTSPLINDTNNTTDSIPTPNTTNKRPLPLPTTSNPKHSTSTIFPPTTTTTTTSTTTVSKSNGTKKPFPLHFPASLQSNPAFQKLINANLAKAMSNLLLTSFTLFPSAVSVARDLPHFPFLQYVNTSNISLSVLTLRFLPRFTMFSAPECFQNSYPTGLLDFQRRNLSSLPTLPHYIGLQDPKVSFPLHSRALLQQQQQQPQQSSKPTSTTNKKSSKSNQRQQSQKSDQPISIYDLAFSTQQAALKSAFLAPIPSLTYQGLREFCPEMSLPIPPQPGDLCETCQFHYQEHIRHFAHSNPMLLKLSETHGPGLRLPCLHRPNILNPTPPSSPTPKQQQSTTYSTNTRSTSRTRRKSNVDIQENDMNDCDNNTPTSPLTQISNDILPQSLPRCQSLQSDPYRSFRATPHSTGLLDTYDLGDQDFFVFPGMVPFPMLLALATIYLQHDPIPQDISPFVRLPNGEYALNPLFLQEKQDAYTRERLLKSFQWLVSKLKYPVVYSTAIVEFEPDILKTFYPDNTLPPIVVIPDTPPAHRLFSATSDKNKFLSSSSTTTTTTLSNTNNSTTSTLPSTTSIHEHDIDEQTIIDKFCLDLDPTFPTQCIQDSTVKIIPSKHKNRKPVPMTKQHNNLSPILPQNIVQPFPYELNENTIPLFRSLLFHMNELSNMHKWRLWRHAGAVFSLKSNEYIETYQQNVVDPRVFSINPNQIENNNNDNLLQQEIEQNDDDEININNNDDPQQQNKRQKPNMKSTTILSPSIDTNITTSINHNTTSTNQQINISLNTNTLQHIQMNQVQIPLYETNDIISNPISTQPLFTFPFPNQNQFQPHQLQLTTSMSMNDTQPQFQHNSIFDDTSHPIEQLDQILSSPIPNDVYQHYPKDSNSFEQDPSNLNSPLYHPQQQIQQPTFFTSSHHSTINNVPTPPHNTLPLTPPINAMSIMTSDNEFNPNFKLHMDLNSPIQANVQHNQFYTMLESPLPDQRFQPDTVFHQQ